MDNNWASNQFREYDLNLEEIPRLNYKDSKIDELMAANRPVVITGSKLVKSAEKWTLEYLESNMGHSDYRVFTSKTHNFKFFDDKKISKTKDFKVPMRKLDLKLPQFMKRLREWKIGDDRIYLQQGLNNTVGPAIVKDFLDFDWDFCNTKQTKHNWGPLTSNLLLIGLEGNVTPCHYDEQHNLFAQIYGFKRCILFAPNQFECLYAHPVFDPHDRQSMVDFDKPDYTRFPKFRNIKGFETVVNPGDVLYIPIDWWHHIESLQAGGHTISVNFWYKDGPNAAISYPLKDHQKVAIMRNIEKMLVDVLQDPKEVPPLLRAIVLGRYTE